MSSVQTTTETRAWREDELNDVAARVLKHVQADAAQVTLVGDTSHLTRFAGNQIHQNVSERDLQVQLCVAIGSRVGRASTNDLSDEALAAAVADATALARLQPDDPEWPGFAGPQTIVPVHAVLPRTLECGPAERAAVAAVICQAALRDGLTAAGSYTTGLRQLAIANSHGLWAYHASTLADFNAVAMSEDSSGWAAYTGTDAGLVDAPALAAEAIEKALRSRRPQVMEPGEYPVILEEYAVLDLLQYLGFGVGAEEVREGRSFMSGHAGKLVINPAISIWDDPRDPHGLPCPFDHEGLPGRRVDLIKDGRVGSPVHDMRSAKLEGVPSTGHHAGGSPFFGGGPQATRMVMSTGTSTKAEMLANTERGIWVTRFHYCNRLDPKATTLTGMTRDGTFWIEDGKLVRPLKNMRFTHSILHALRDVDMIGRETKVETNWFGGAHRAPALRIKNFRFTGKTTF